jgi:hypothetical protein
VELSAKTPQRAGLAGNPGNGAAEEVPMTDKMPARLDRLARVARGVARNLDFSSAVIFHV